MFSTELDPPQHPQHGLVGAAVQRAVERRDACRHRRVGVDVGGADAAHGVGRAVLFVVGVEDEEDVERLREALLRHVLHFGLLEHHREEVLGEVEVVVRVDVGQAHVVAVGEGGQGRHLGDQPHRRHVALFGVVDLLGVGVEGRERADPGEQHPHRVGVVAEALEELLQVLVDEGVVGDVVDPAVELRPGRQLAEDQQVGDLEEGGALAELLDRVAAVFEDPRLAVDVGDRRAAGGGVGEGRVVGHHPEFVLGDFDLAQVHRPHGPVGDRQLVGLPGAVVGDGQGVRAGGDPPVGGCVSGLLLGGHHPSSSSGFELERPVSQLASPGLRRFREARIAASGRYSAVAGNGSNRVIASSSSKRSSISSRLSRATRSVPNSSTLKEASTVP